MSKNCQSCQTSTCFQRKDDTRPVLMQEPLETWLNNGGIPISPQSVFLTETNAGHSRLIESYMTGLCLAAIKNTFSHSNVRHINLECQLLLGKSSFEAKECENKKSLPSVHKWKHIWKVEKKTDKNREKKRKYWHSPSLPSETLGLLSTSPAYNLD